MTATEPEFFFRSTGAADVSVCIFMSMNVSPRHHRYIQCTNACIVICIYDKTFK